MCLFVSNEVNDQVPNGPLPVRSLMQSYTLEPAATELSLTSADDLTFMGLFARVRIHCYSLGLRGSSDGHLRSEEIRLRAGSRQTEVPAGPGGVSERQRNFTGNLITDQMEVRRVSLPSSLPPSLLPRSACAARQNGNSIRPNQVSSSSADPRTMLLISLRSSGVRVPPTPIH